MEAEHENSKPTNRERAAVSSGNSISCFYANASRVFGTPEEVFVDLGVNVNMFGKVLEECAPMNHRVVLSYCAAKRLALMLSETIRKYEAKYGEIELDPRKRLIGPGQDA